MEEKGSNNTSEGEVKEEEPLSNEDDFGDFGDFEVKEDSSTWSTPIIVEPPVIQQQPLLSKQQHLSVQDIIHSIEPQVVSVIASNFKGSSLEKDSSCCTNSFEEDPIWSQLQSFNESPSLNHFAWNSSKANANLMSSLQIDARNILYDGKWKSRTLPSFTETNSSQLLEPTKVEAKVSSSSDKDSLEEEQSVLPVEFDWKDSCLTDPLENNQDNSSQVTKNEKSTTIIDSFPLLNFMQSSSLIFPINGWDPKL